ncbi:uncharacterized protein LOC111276864 isoform X1 [Durio zibethinus]|uniref:Uncharacterized protein LOC111276864 isoform X1 n=1 Tax=Durio zibethinus TaxID=66656 RepID=A0A6P5WRM9_DURZI|nr:uncharacterized protein LOC111276864 isoform X1 [Durio zibethinus]
MWNPRNKGGYPRRISAKARGSSVQENNSVHEDEASMSDEDITIIKDLLDAVVHFDILLDRRKHTNFLDNLGRSSEMEPKLKVVQDAGIVLVSLVCKEALEREPFISISAVMFQGWRLLYLAD